MRRLLAAGLLLGLLTPVWSQATTWYVDNNATRCAGCTDSNSCGQAQTITTGKDTIAAGLACVVSAGGANHRLEIRGSTSSTSPQVYAESIRTAQQTIPSGTSYTNAITIASYTGEWVSLKPTSGGNVVQLAPVGTAAQYIVFDGSAGHTATQTGLIFDGSTTIVQDCVFIKNINHVRFKNVEVKNCWSMGVLGGDANTRDNEFLNCHIHHNGTTRLNHNMYLLQQNLLIEGCEVHDATGYGIQIYGASSGTYNANGAIIRRNRIYNNAKVSDAFAQVILSNGDGIQFYNNLVYNGPPGKSGVNLPGYGSTNGTKIYNNTIYNNPGVGLTIAAGTPNTDVKNNIIYLNGTNLSNSSTSTTNITNLFTNPLFLNPGAGDFHLTSGSAAINTGTNLSTTFTTDFAGTTRTGTWDIGAYTFETAPPLHLEFQTPPGNTQEDTTMAAVVVRVVDTGGIVQTGHANNCVMSKASGPGTVAGTLTKAPVSGICTFNDLSINDVGTYTLLVTSTGTTSVTSPPFSITAAPVAAAVPVPLLILRQR